MKILVLVGNRFFGKKLSRLLVEAGHDLTLLNRGNFDDELGRAPHRLRCDRKDAAALREALGSTQGWHVVFDQVCFEAADARAISEMLAGRVGHYVFTSSMSVYDLGASIQEQAFDPLAHTFAQDVSSRENYAEAKRQCETVFFNQNSFPVTAVRFPIVTGVDDYTGRLCWHVERVRQGAPVYFPNLDARLSLIHSDDAAKVLMFLAGSLPLGPLNAAAAEPLRLATMMQEIETIMERKVSILKTGGEDVCSPYGIESDWFMDVQKLVKTGMQPRPVSEWLQPTLKNCMP